MLPDLYNYHLNLLLKLKGLFPSIRFYWQQFAVYCLQTAKAIDAAAEQETQGDERDEEELV